MKWLSPEERAKAKKLRKDGFSWKKIAVHMQISAFTIQYNIDPVFRAAKDARCASVKNATAKFDYREMLPVEDGIERNPEFDPRVHGYPVWENAAEMLLGCPPIGRRASDKN